MTVIFFIYKFKANERKDIGQFMYLDNVSQQHKDSLKEL